jgi:molybdenum cofactor biosynthesis enzyme MoaA
VKNDGGNLTPIKKDARIEHPRLVAIETTNRCNAKCPFCPNQNLQRDKHHMADDLFEKVIEECGQFPLPAIEPFLNGEPFVDPKILPRLELIRNRLSDTKLRLYTNGYALKPKTIDALVGLGIDHLYISLNTLNPKAYRSIMGFDLERTLKNLDYLTDIARRDKVARKITFRMTRTESTPLSEQEEFEAFSKKRGVRSFIVGLFNYKGDISSQLPVPNFPCEHITRLDILSNGMVTLCCMDQEGTYAWGDATKNSILDIYNGPEANRYRHMHRSGKRMETEPCGECNVFWPSLGKMSPIPTVKFSVQAGMYFLRHRPSGKRRPTSISD